MASSSVSSPGSQKYDVFLNFRGEDVRFNFLGYLIAALNHASLNIFVDYKLERGKSIKPALMEAIQDSKVALTIFSKGYASSSWTLDELVKIMESRENPTLRQKVMPVFHHVTPSDVRNVQRGVFAQDFAKHENDYQSRRKVPDWKAAMKAAGGLSGRIVNETSLELQVLIQIVDDVLTILGRYYPTLSNPCDNNSRKKSFHAFIGAELREFLHNRQANIPQQQTNGLISSISRQRKGSITTTSRQHGLLVQEDLNTVLTSIRDQVGGNSESPSGQRSVTSISRPPPPISCHYGVNSNRLESTMVPTNSVTQEGLPMSRTIVVGNNTNGYGLGGTAVPYNSGYRVVLGNGNWGYGYRVDHGNGYCGYHVDFGNGNWGYYVDFGNGNLLPYEGLLEQDRREQGQGQGKAGSGQTGAIVVQTRSGHTGAVAGSSKQNHSRGGRRPDRPSARLSLLQTYRANSNNGDR